MEQTCPYIRMTSMEEMVEHKKERSRNFRSFSSNETHYTYNYKYNYKYNTCIKNAEQ